MRQWLKLDYANYFYRRSYFFLLFFGWLSFTCIQTWRTQIQPNQKKEREIRVIDGFCIFFLCAAQFNRIVHQGIENQAQMIFCLICAFIQMNENRAAFSPFIAYPSLGFYSSCLLSFDENTRTRTEREKKKELPKKRKVCWHGDEKEWLTAIMICTECERDQSDRNYAGKQGKDNWRIGYSQYLHSYLPIERNGMKKKSDHPFSALDLMNWTPLARKWIDEDATYRAHKKQQHRTEIIFSPF